jgi:hypothetical protein
MIYLTRIRNYGILCAACPDNWRDVCDHDRDREGLAPMSEDEPVETTPAARLTPDEVAALMNAAIALARSEGIAVPPDLARKTFAVTRKLARGRDAG